MSTIKEIKEILYPNYDKTYNYPENPYWNGIVNNALRCTDCDSVPKVDNAGEVFTDDKIQYQLMHNGVLIHEGCYHGKWMTDVIKVGRGHHEPQEEKLFYEVLKYIPKNSVMVECGSFWAYYSLWFNKIVKNGRNIMIEPNPEKLEIGKLNFQLNNFEGEFFNGVISTLSQEPSMFYDDHLNTISVPSIPIDYLFIHADIDKINILHADIQGNEETLLNSAKDSLTNNKIDFLFLATHSPNNIFIEILKSYNYHILESFEVEESWFDDGLILACSPKIIDKIDKTKFKVSKR